jgi:hypothetical protein
MANWDMHHISVAGPPKAIRRFVKDFGIIGGAIDMASGEILDGRGGKPAIRLGPGRHVIEKCVVGPCSVEIEFESVGFVWPDAFYSYLVRKYPTLHFLWRFWLDMGNGLGYVDETGNHLFEEDIDGQWVAVNDEPEDESPDTRAMYRDDLAAQSDKVARDTDKPQEADENTLTDEEFLKILDRLGEEGD